MVGMRSNGKTSPVRASLSIRMNKNLCGVGGGGVAANTRENHKFIMLLVRACQHFRIQNQIKKTTSSGIEGLPCQTKLFEVDLLVILTSG